MNTQILQKCIVELEKETPNLAYIRGILETLVDISNTGIVKTPINQNTTKNISSDTQERSDEDVFLDKYLNGTTAGLS